MKEFNDIWKPWDFTTGMIMKCAARTVKADFFSKPGDIIISCGPLLQHDEVSYKVYDMLLLLTRPYKEYEDDLLTLVKKFVSTVPMYDFVLSMRRSLHINSINTATPITAIMHICALILLGYNRGMLAGVNSNSKKVVVEDGTICALEFLLYMVCLLRLDRIKDDTGELAQRGALPEYAHKIVTHYNKKLDRELVQVLRATTTERLVELMNNLTSNIFCGQMTSMYNEINSEYFAVNNVTNYGGQEREDTIGKMDSVAMSVFFTTYLRGLVDDDAFKHRKVYVRDKGVVIRFKKSIDGIDFISLREYHRTEPFEEHYLLLCYEITPGTTRVLQLDMTSLSKCYIPVLFEKDTIVFSLIFNWLGLCPQIDLSREAFVEKLGREFIPVRKTVIKYVSMFDEYTAEDNIYYEAPAQWNYDAGVTTGTSKKSKDYILESKTIGRYTRKLPAGQKASQEAKDLAKKVFMDLGEDRTLVDEFERKQRRTFGKSDSY